MGNIPTEKKTMRSIEHTQHIRSNVSWNTCPECNADRERRFIQPRWVGYRLVHEYLTFAQAGFDGKGVRTWWAGDSLTPEQFAREFKAALHKRISLRVEPPRWRKLSHGYLERLGQFRSRQGGRFYADAGYLRQFARVGASALGS